LTPVLLLSLLSAGISGRWQSYTNTDFVNDLCGTSETLFLATNGGLKLFSTRDTSFLEAFTNTEGLPTNTLLCCDLDAEGNVWIGTDGGGLVVFDRERRQFLVHPLNRLIPLKVNCLMVAGDTAVLGVGADNGAWLIALNGTMLDFEDDSWTYLSGLQSPTVLGLGHDDDFWVGSNLGVDRVTHDLTIEHFAHPFGDSVKAVVRKQDTLFILTEWGVARLDESTRVFIPVLTWSSRQVAFDMTEYRGLLYIILDGGLGRMNPGGVWEVLWLGPTRSIWSTTGAEDLWLGFGGSSPAAGQGMGRLSLNDSQHVYTAQRLASNVIPSAAFDTAGGIYACHYLTYGGFRTASHLEPDGTWEQLRDTLIHACLVAVDSRNRVWFGHWWLFWSGISVFDPATREWKVYTWGPSDYRNVICGLGIDPHDVAWVFNQAGEVVAIDTSGAQEFFRVPGVSAPSGGGYDFAFDGQGRVWFGNSSGLAMIDWAGTLHNRDDDGFALYSRGLSSANVLSVAIDHRGRPWIATSQGAGVLQDSTFQLFTTSNSGILSNNACRVRIDARHNVWFLTDAGLSVFNPDSGKWSTPEGNRGLIPNLSARTGFYSWLALDERHRRVLVGTQGGLSTFTYDVPPETSIRRVAVHPNPFVAGQHHEIVFDHMPDTVAVGIEIHALSGELIATLGHNHLKLDAVGHEATWDVRNDRGQEVASGIYVAVVTTARERRLVRFAVVR